MQILIWNSDRKYPHTHLGAVGLQPWCKVEKSRNFERIGLREEAIFCFLCHLDTTKFSKRKTKQNQISNMLRARDGLFTLMVLEINPGYDSLFTVNQILNEEIRDTPKDIAPNPIHLCAPVISCDVERSFSLYKNILPKIWRNIL
ncbi:hypothetical protein C0J52_05961 [Blattella germanica]|nr:hypothetical protein C0J52_05961 [Blattella germanica]